MVCELIGDKTGASGCREGPLGDEVGSSLWLMTCVGSNSVGSIRGGVEVEYISGGSNAKCLVCEDTA